MKKTLLFLSLPFLISIFLTSESFAFSTSEGAVTSFFQKENTGIQAPINHPLLFVDEVAVGNSFEQNFYPKINFFSEKCTRFNALLLGNTPSENKALFLFKKNLKKLLSQQIFPFHLFW
ncbi:MAG: hypothetical protein R2781_00435 [Flavobacteriaceae bacterium]